MAVFIYYRKRALNLTWGGGGWYWVFWSNYARPKCNMAENEKPRLHKGIFLAIPHLHKMKFAVLEIKNCNATESKSFTDADCKFDMIKMEREEEELKHEVRSLNVNFATLFRPGLDFLTACQDKNVEDIEKLDKPQMEAMVLLNNYFQNIGENVEK